MSSMMYGQAYDNGRPEYVPRQRKSLDSCGECVRYLLIAFNIAFWMANCVVIGVTTWILVERNYMSAVYGNVLMTVGGYLIVVGACIAWFTTMLGCCGAITKNKIMLIVYLCAMIAVFLFMIIGSILCIVYRTQIREEIQYTVMEKTLKKSYGVDLKDPYNEFVTNAWNKAQRRIKDEPDVTQYMRDTLQKDYGHSLHIAYNAQVTRDWDKCQQELKCCAAADESWAVYRASEWYNQQSGLRDVDKPYVPTSCCVRDQYGDYLDLQKCQTFTQGPPGQNSGDENTALHYRGCYDAGRDFIMEFSGYLIGMGMGVGLAEISVAVLAFILLRLVD